MRANETKLKHHEDLYAKNFNQTCIDNTNVDNLQNNNSLSNNV